jgi:DNA processing protein
VTTPGHLDSADAIGADLRARTQALVASALLRLGADTRAARLFRDVILPDFEAGKARPDVVEHLAALLDLPRATRRASIAKARADAARAIDRAQASGFRLSSLLDDDYPPLLRQIPDPPIVVWQAGLPGLCARPTVAIVGARQAGPASRSMARRLARGLAEAGLVVVSGLARGVDAEAHRGALETSGRTVAVLGSGLDVIYPREHLSLARDVAASGALLSELPPGTPPVARHFPLRNRLISGLSRAIVVVEAGEKSGSLITARMALEQGRDVLAVPGNVVSGCHRGCHALIKDGARLVENVGDILDEIGWAAPGPAGVKGPNLKQESGLLARMRPGEPLGIDALADRSGRPVQEILTELGRLEIEGVVARMAGGTFVRLD